MAGEVVAAAGADVGEAEGVGGGADVGRGKTAVEECERKRSDDKAACRCVRQPAQAQLEEIVHCLHLWDGHVRRHTQRCHAEVVRGFDCDDQQEHAERGDDGRPPTRLERSAENVSPLIASEIAPADEGAVEPVVEGGIE